MSDYNNDSNGELPYEGDDIEATVPTNEQYAEAQFPQDQLAEGEYEEEYIEPENSYYTNEYQQQDYYETPEDGQAYEEVEPVIFVKQGDENPAEDANVYSTDLPNYQTSPNPQTSIAAQYGDTTEYAAVETHDDEGYEAADEYLEPAPYAEPEYVDETTAEPVLGGYAAETYAETNYSAESATQNYQQQPYAEAGYANEPQVSAEYAPAYQEPLASAQSDYQQNQYDQGQYREDEYEPNEQNYDNIGYDQAGQLQAIGEAQPLDADVASGQQDFRQEYAADVATGRVFPKAWAVTGLAIILLMGAGFYYLYANFVSPSADGDVPVILADKSEIKTFPAGDTASDTSGEKNTDRIQNGSATTGDGVTLTEPTLLDSREEVVDEPTKSEDRVETFDGVVADNDDKDIQNVLTLIKSSANNVEILLKPDDVSQLDQNQISIEGLETILVDATPVRLDDLIAQANQQPESALERVAAANVDDLPVVGEGADDPFKDVIAGNNTVNADDGTASELPEANTQPLSAQPLPETDLSKAIAIAANQIEEPINVVVEAPKPVSRPAVPTAVPNTLSPQIAVAAGGAYGVQLASLPNEAAARQAYSQFAAKFPNILAGYNPIIREAIIPDKGTFYRVFAGPLISYNDANQLCANLRSAGISGCFARKM